MNMRLHTDGEYLLLDYFLLGRIFHLNFLAGRIFLEFYQSNHYFYCINCCSDINHHSKTLNRRCFALSRQKFDHLIGEEYLQFQYLVSCNL